MSNSSITEKLIESMCTFSGPTRDIRSVFREAGIDVEIYETVQQLKVLLSDREQRKRMLVNVKPLNDTQYQRFFTDGYSDVVDFESIGVPSVIESSDISDTELSDLVRTLKSDTQRPDLISELRTGIPDACDWRPIESDGERELFVEF